MKKLLVFLLVMNIGFLTACGGNAENTGSDSSTSMSEKDNEGSSDNGEAEDTEGSKETETFGYEDLAKAPFLFASGAGAWGTYLTINPDGTFVGEYHDSEMGLTGVDYNGTVYQCRFNGRFSNIKQISDKEYSMEISELTMETEPETEEIIDGILYKYTVPYGIFAGEEAKIYLPDLDISSFSEEFRMWVNGSYYFEGDILPTISIETQNSEGIYVFTQQQ